MTSADDTRAMADIMAKLNAASNESFNEPENVAGKAPLASGNVSQDAKEMYTILAKLHNATDEANQVVTEAIQEDVNNAAGLYSDSRIDIGSVAVEMQETTIIPGMKKTCYKILEHGVVTYSDIMLFETAMGIVKQLVGQSKKNNIAQLMELDSQYGSSLYEAATHKKRGMAITESVKKDIILAKHTRSVTQMKEIKRRIKSIL